MSDCITLKGLQDKLNNLYSEGQRSLNPEESRKALLSYSSRPEDWKQYVKWDDRSYTRNLVDKGNGKYNLIILCWGPGQGSPIHDHSNSHCFVKILDGKLQETLYALPKASECSGEDSCKMEEVKEPMVFEKDQVTYIHDNQGVAHRMENPSHTDGCVTLHLYTPPYESCHKFDDRTSQSEQVSMHYHQDFSASAPSCQGNQTSTEGTCCGNK